MRRPTLVAVSSLGCLCGLAAFALRWLRLGMFQTGSMHCPAFYPGVDVLALGLVVAAWAASLGALAMARWWTRDGPGRGKRLGLDVAAPLAIGLVTALLSSLPMPCI